MKAAKKQDGVTLILAILVLAVVLAIGFSLTKITMNEIRSSGDLSRSEPAYYAADAVSEEALFKVKRQVPESSISYTQKLNNVSLNAPPPKESYQEYPIFQIRVKKPYTSFSNTQIRYPVFNFSCPAPDPSSNSQVCQKGGSSYGRIKITYLNTGHNDPLKAYLCEFDPTWGVDDTGQIPNTYRTLPCSDPNDTQSGYWIANGDSLLPESSRDWNFINPNKQQEIILFNGASVPSGDIVVQVESYDDTKVTGKGLPLVGQKAVEINASFGGVLRKVRTTVPTFASGGGPVAGSIIVTADDVHSTYFNGTSLGSDSVWQSAETYAVTFQTGKNVFAISATDTGWQFGVLAHVVFGSNVSGTGMSWKVSESAPSGWQQPNFDDSSWANAVVTGSYGDWPWYTNVTGMPNSTPGKWVWSSADPSAGNRTIYLRGTFNNDSSTSYTPVTYTYNQTVSENGTANLSCVSGTIVSYTSNYGANCSSSCPVICGTCSIGSTSCSVTYTNASCGDCAYGCVKNGQLSITCGQ